MPFTAAQLEPLRAARTILFRDAGSSTEISSLYLKYVAGIAANQAIAATDGERGRRYGLPLLPPPHGVGSDPGAPVPVPETDARADADMRAAYAAWVADRLAREKPRLLLYGASWYARTLAYALREDPYRLDVVGAMVTDPAKAPRDLLGIPVTGAAAADPAWRTLPVVIAADERFHGEIMNTLQELGFGDVMPLTFELAGRFMRQLIRGFFQQSRRYTLLDSPYSATEFILCRTADPEMPDSLPEQLPHWIFRGAVTAEWDSAKELLRTTDLLEHQQAVYGDMPPIQPLLADIPTPAPADAIPDIYMAQSRHDAAIRTDSPSFRLVKPIHVGAAEGGPRLAALADDSGDNISRKNSLYSEMTAVYWMWKNAPPAKYLGLCHYRRHFHLDRDDLQRLVHSGIDIVVTAPPLDIPDNRNFYLWSGYLDKEMFEQLDGVIRDLAPDCLAAYQAVCSSQLLVSWNMFIMRRDWFERYAAWCFSLTEELEIRSAARGGAGRRSLGYVTEILLSTFLARHKGEARVALADRILLS